MASEGLGVRRRVRGALAKRFSKGRRVRFVRRVADLYEAASWFHLTLFLFYGAPIDASHGLTWRKRFALARRMRRNTTKIQTGLSYRGHLAIAVKVLSVPRSVEGVMVEAGCWKGGTTTNLSLIAEAAGRSLIVYDSFEGLPPAVEGDHWASEMGEGAFKGELEEVRANVTKYGAVGVCEFRKGWFSDTMGDHSEPIVCAYVDVDYQSSFHDCIIGLWPYLNDDGYMFIDEYHRLDYCALFFSERYWRTYFDRPPPGLMGAGSGVGLGQVFVGPLRFQNPGETPSTLAWTRKDFYAEWDFVVDDAPSVPLRGGPGAAHGREGWTLTTESMEEHEENTIAHLIATDPVAREFLEAKIAAALETPEGKARLDARLSKNNDALIAAALQTDEGKQKLAEALSTGAEGANAAGTTHDEDPGSASES